METRAGEVASFSADDRSRAEVRIGTELDGKIIRLKDGLQAYTATFFGNPELAKKNAKLIFLSEQDGGYFEKIFAHLTAEKFVVAHLLKTLVDGFVRKFTALKRRKERVADWKADYSSLLGSEIVPEHGDVIDQMIPQCAVFICGALFATEDIHLLDKWNDQSILAAISSVLGYAKRNPSVANKSWPSLLKSKSFFDSYVSAVREARKKEGSGGTP